MDTVTLGRTALEVSVVALGAGGHSRLGIRRGASEAEAAELVRAAVGRGITIIDTAPVYGTEPVVGAGLVGLRDGVVISSKVRTTVAGSAHDGGDFIAPAAVRESVEASLRALRTDRIDILHLHGVRPHQYEFCLNHLAPEMLKLREQGKIRFLGITEGFGVDAEHEVMRRAAHDGVWDVLMLGHNFVNPSAAELVLPHAQASGLGVMCMYAVRGALARRDTLQALVDRLVAQGEVDRGAADRDDPAAFLVADGVAGSLTEAAYRFCRHTPGIDVVMTGTGSLAHLDQNIASIQGKPLPADVLQRLTAIFRRVRTATGDPE
jgi:L-galactose dehydrogenase